MVNISHAEDTFERCSDVMKNKYYAKFFREFLSRPRAVGALLPSSPQLAKRMVNSIDWNDVEVTLEYGPGTGAFTGQIIQQISPDSRFLAIELSPQFAQLLATQFPQATICNGNVADVESICAQHDIGQVDAIVSGLPWAVFHDQDQERYLDAMMTVLRKRGQFVTFGYLQGLLLPAARRFRRRLEKYFSNVEASSPVWSNFPPAIYYHCRR